MSSAAASSSAEGDEANSIHNPLSVAILTAGRAAPELAELELAVNAGGTTATCSSTASIHWMAAGSRRASRRRHQ